MGPYTMEARRYGLAQVLSIQEEVNGASCAQGRPCIDLINDEELARIYELIDANTWPDRWTGDEIRGDEMVAQVLRNGMRQPLMWAEEIVVAQDDGELAARGNGCLETAHGNSSKPPHDCK
jgi:DNA sulfur modification protein DndC